MSPGSPFAQHLHTNYAPSADEINDIRSLVDERQKVVDTLDIEIAVLVQRRDEHAKFVKEHSDLLSPIRRVPNDILSLIFLTCIPRSASSTSTRLSGDHPALIISHVCQRWRHLSLNTPLLWTVIDIRTPWHPNPDQYGRRDVEEQWGRPMKAFLAMTQLWISRSADCALTVAFSGGLTFQEGVNLVAEPVLAARRLMRSLVNTLCDTSYRWKSVYLSVEFSDDETVTAFSQIPCDKLPLLETVHVNTLGPLPFFLGERLDLITRTALVKAPRLRRLGFGSFRSSLLALPIKWADLTELSLGPLVSQDEEYLPLSILAMCINVTRCSINYQFPLQPHGVPITLADATPNRGLCHLSKLRTLELRGFEPPPLFAANLDFPSLRELIVLWYSPEVVSESLDGGTIELIRKFGHGLTDVVLDWASLNVPRLSDILQHLPNVVNLRLGQGNPYQMLLAGHHPPVIFDSALEKLMPRSESDHDSGMCCCPKLEKFRCKLEETVEVSEDALSRLIMARRNRLNADVALLQSFVVVFPSHRPDELIRGRLEEMGVDLEGMDLITVYKKPKGRHQLDFTAGTLPDFDVDSETANHEDYISTVGPVMQTLGDLTL